jgi:hypothetical protein
MNETDRIGERQDGKGNCEIECRIEMAKAGVTSVIRRDDESCGKDKIFSEEFSHLS